MQNFNTTELLEGLLRTMMLRTLNIDKYDNTGSNIDRLDKHLENNYFFISKISCIFGYQI